jgi:hypothetical protein
MSSRRGTGGRAVVRLAVGLSLLRRGSGRDWLPGESEGSGDLFRLCCSIRGDECETRLVDWHGGRHRPKCRVHRVKMKWCDGCRLCRPDLLW